VKRRLVRNLLSQAVQEIPHAMLRGTIAVDASGDKLRLGGLPILGAVTCGAAAGLPDLVRSTRRAISSWGMSQERVVISYLLMLSLEQALVCRPFSYHDHSTAISRLDQERAATKGLLRHSTRQLARQLHGFCYPISP
jgi:hypothetical protein